MQYIVLPVVQFLILLIALSQFLILPIALLQFLILGIAALVLLVLFVRCCTIVAILAMISFRMAVKAFLFIAIWLFISIMVRFGFVGVIAASPIDGKAGALWLLLGTLIGSIILSGFYFDFYYDLIALARRQPYEKSEQRISRVAFGLNWMFAIETSFCGTCSGFAYVYASWGEWSVKDIAWCGVIAFLILMLAALSGAFLRVPRRM